jgi:formylglycine-generating enzyme required for sulfatase activity
MNQRRLALSAAACAIFSLVLWALVREPQLRATVASHPPSNATDLTVVNADESPVTTTAAMMPRFALVLIVIGLVTFAVSWFLFTRSRPSGKLREFDLAMMRIRRNARTLRSVHRTRFWTPIFTFVTGLFLLACWAANRTSEWYTLQEKGLNLVQSQVSKEVDAKNKQLVRLVDDISIVEANRLIDQWEALADSDECWPSYPDKIAKYRTWLKEADALISGTQRTQIDTSEDARDLANLVNVRNEQSRTDIGYSGLKSLEIRLQTKADLAPKGEQILAARDRRDQLASELEEQYRIQTFMLHGTSKSPELAQFLERSEKIGRERADAILESARQARGSDSAAIGEELVAQAGNRMNVWMNGIDQDLSWAFAAYFMSADALRLSQPHDIAYAASIHGWACYRVGKRKNAADAMDLAVRQPFTNRNRARLITEQKIVEQHCKMWEDSNWTLVLERHLTYLHDDLAMVESPDYLDGARILAATDREYAELLRLVSRLRALRDDAAIRWVAEVDSKLPICGFSPAQAEVRAEKPTCYGLASGISARHGRGIQQRLAAAEELEKLAESHEYREAWNNATDDLRKLPKYQRVAGLASTRIQSEPDLMPLGADTVSGLLEFAHVLSGVVPQRDKDGVLPLNEKSALIFVLVPGGEFRNGCSDVRTGGPRPDEGFQEDETLSTRVRLGPFYISKFETTQAQWIRLTGENPSDFPPNSVFPKGWVRGDHPVEAMTYKEAETVLKWMGFSIPTEVQWEYACRADTETPFAVSRGGYDASASRCGNYDGKACKLAFVDNTGTEKIVEIPAFVSDFEDIHQPVYSTPTNDFGLHGMSGNVREWCRDIWDPVGYRGLVSKPEEDGLRRSFGPERVVRGGSFRDSLLSMRSAARARQKSEAAVPVTGIRAVRHATLLR